MEGTLSLANGKEYTGHWHGNVNTCYGEIIFFTGMTHFIEFLTDPSVKGKIIVATYPGVLHTPIDADTFKNADLQLAGLITQQETIIPVSTHHSLMELLQANNIPVMTGMDTRSIMKQVTKSGEMPAMMKSTQSTKTSVQINQQSSNKEMKLNDHIEHKHIVVLDFGLRNSSIKWLQTLDYKITIVSAKSNLQVIQSLRPDGIIFSGGSGNPNDWNQYFEQYKKMASSYPTIGFGLGHQILAICFGASVEKMKWGHRSFRQPIIDIKTKLVYMSNQNHGYAVTHSSLKGTGLKPSFIAVQDDSIEGLVHEKYPIATYQFHLDGKNEQLETLILQLFSQQLMDNKGERLYAQAK